MSLTAGAATRDISPNKPTALYGYPHVERISTGVHDPLLATVIVLRNCSETLVLASLDILMLDPPFARELRRDTAKVARCPEANVFISCTHTHSGPVTSRLVGWKNDPAVPPPDPEVMNHVQSQLVKAVKQAVANLSSAELIWTSADATGIGGNRLSDDGVTDPECGILFLRSSQTKEPLAASLIYGMHPTVMHEDSTLVSSDFPHYTRLQIQERLGRDIPITYHTAPAGNQSPRRCVTGQTFAEAERLGRKLGMAACSSLDALSDSDWQEDPTLAGQLVQVELVRNPIRTRHEAEKLLAEYQDNYERLQNENAPRAEVRTAECAVFGAEGTVALAQAAASGELDKILRDYSPADVQVLRIGGVFLAGLPGECFTEYGLGIKRNAPMKAFVVSLVNGSLQGYIVTPEAAKNGGYEATNAVFAPESGAALGNAALEMISNLSDLSDESDQSDSTRMRN